MEASSASTHTGLPGSVTSQIVPLTWRKKQQLYRSSGTMAATLAEPEKTSGLDTNKKCGTLRCSMGFCQVFIGASTRNCTCMIFCQHYFGIYRDFLHVALKY